MQNVAPVYLNKFIKIYKPQRTLRSSNQWLLITPNTRLKTYGERTFAFHAAQAWNNLPKNIKICTNIDIFKAKVKTFLFKAAYCDN